jgi:hypothetical protein
MKTIEAIAAELVRRLMRDAGVPASFVWFLPRFRALADELMNAGVRYVVVERGAGIMCLRCGDVLGAVAEVRLHDCRGGGTWHETPKKSVAVVVEDSQLAPGVAGPSHPAN